MLYACLIIQFQVVHVEPAIIVPNWYPCRHNGEMGKNERSYPEVQNPDKFCLDFGDESLETCSCQDDPGACGVVSKATDLQRKNIEQYQLCIHNFFALNNLNF